MDDGAAAARRAGAGAPAAVIAGQTAARTCNEEQDRQAEGLEHHHDRHQQLAPLGVLDEPGVVREREERVVDDDA
jgi:hypothetical protein